MHNLQAVESTATQACYSGGILSAEERQGEQIEAHRRQTFAQARKLSIFLCCLISGHSP
jgi:hypothetical protein